MDEGVLILPYFQPTRKANIDRFLFCFLQGVTKHLHLQARDLEEYEEKLEKVLKRYVKRLQWLLSGKYNSSVGHFYLQISLLNIYLYDILFNSEWSTRIYLWNVGFILKTSEDIRFEIRLYLSNLKTYKHFVYLSMKYKDSSTKWDIHFKYKNQLM